MAARTKKYLIYNLNKKVLELTTLYEISKILVSSPDLMKSIHSILRLLSELLGMKRGTLTLYHPGTKELRIEAAYGLTKEQQKKGRYGLGEGITGRVMKAGMPMIVQHIGNEPLFLNRTGARKDLSKEDVSFICVPVKVQNKAVGVLSVDRLFSNEVSFEEDIRLLSIIASLIGQTVRLHQLVEKAKKDLVDENVALRQELKERYHFENIISLSKAMEEVFDMVGRVAGTKSTVLLRGESGTGKELIARAIHYNSPRAGKAFVKLSCAALPESLLESELFGHEKGAFTGAIAERVGRFEFADGGTLFLDEIGEITPSIQVKLLRVLQEKRFERVGGSRTLEVDVRLVAATNRDLEKAVSDGHFREDLYYRLNVIPIFIPPLRERREDIPLLVEYFLDRAKKEHRKSLSLTPSALETMMRYPWPGNVRELENCIERMVIMFKGETIDVDDLPLSIRLALQEPPVPKDAPLPDLVGEMEKRRIEDVLKKYHGIQARAARHLGLTARQLGYKIKKYHLKNLAR